MSPRLACLSVPLFPLAARLRSEPELLDQAIVVVDGDGPSARVVAATRRARRAGIAPGHTLTQSRGILPGLVSRGRDPICEEASRQALVDVATRFSPRIEDPGEGMIYLDLDGLDRHFEDEEALGRALMAATDAIGLPTRVGIAASKLAARVAARLAGSPRVVPPGDEAEFLAPLPLTVLAPAIEASETLERWGIRSVGELARLSTADVTSRLGRVGERLHAAARGIDPEPLVPWTPPLAFTEGLQLEWPLVQLEPFLFLAQRALDRLVARLALRGLGCLRLDLSLRLEAGGVDDRSLHLPAPTREVRSLLTILRLELEKRPPTAPVEAFTLVARPEPSPSVQLSLFGPPSLPPDRLATTLARLFALLGPGRAGRPAQIDRHRPEGFRLAPFRPPTPPTIRPAPQPRRGLLSVRVLRPPVPLEVLVSPTDDRTPTRPLGIHPAPGHDESPRPRLDGRVRVAAGPWYLEEAWWEDEAIDREYWDVELATGGLFRIFRDATGGEWYADGVYD